MLPQDYAIQSLMFIYLLAVLTKMMRFIFELDHVDIWENIFLVVWSEEYKINLFGVKWIHGMALISVYQYKDHPEIKDPKMSNKPLICIDIFMT